MRPASPQRVKADAKGRWAETLAAFVLRAKGYRILARRYRAPMGEIDLIARRGRRLAFVEVKARRSLDDGAWSVTPRQQRRIAQGAQSWLARRPELARLDIGFDVILLAPRALPRHIQDAFRV